MMFHNVYEGKKVLVTGHTGFKGSWLIAWLKQLGAEVCGFAFDPPTEPSHYGIMNMKEEIRDVRGDVRDLAALFKAVGEFKPDMVFHLAAQPLVRASYEDPVVTFQTNVLGTVNLLESIRQSPGVRAAVIITSDKCYRNVEWEWGYREDDALGGKDPYSASKACAELVIHSYINSFFKTSGVRVASARAGNVIGGGDWANDRVVPDAMRAWPRKQPLILRHISATRPWQHVLEPLSAYLWLGAQLWEKNPEITYETFNFGPDANVYKSVGDLIRLMSRYWPNAEWELDSTGINEKHESMILKLCCDRALNQLGWKATLTFEETVDMTMKWYRIFYEEGQSALPELTYDQIGAYAARAKEQGLLWARSANTPSQAR
jgi:CDP-glucose 4,6-dehydratase